MPAKKFIFAISVMKKNGLITIILLLLLSLLISLLANIYLLSTNKQNNSQSISSKTLECLDLWERKKERLFGDEVGNYRVIFNSDINTCLVGNIFYEGKRYTNNPKYFIFVIDLNTDEILLAYQVFGDEIYDGVMSREDAIKKYKGFGLKY